MGNVASDTADYDALRHRVGAAWVPRDVIRVTGPEAVSWLQGQLSQDVAALEVGRSAESLLLAPQGKIDALLRVTRTGPDELVLDVDGGHGDALLSRLGRFKLRTKADLDTLAWRCLAVRGPGVPGLAPGESGWSGLALPADWPGLLGVDLLGESPPVPAGVPVCDLAALEVVRVEAGVPRMGAELTERTIPAEAGVVERTVSFTKGCFTGQELVARIDARGSRVPRHLRGVVVEADTVPPVGAALAGDGDRELGHLTSVVVSPGLGAPVGLAYVRREVEPPAKVVVRWTASGSAGPDGEPGAASTEVPARVQALPLLP